MNPITYALVALRSLALRSLALLFSLQGRQSESNTLLAIASAREAGRNVDTHMAAVADALKHGQSANWADVLARIEADSDRLQGA
jgi:hypothetical protein